VRHVLPRNVQLIARFIGKTHADTVVYHSTQSRLTTQRPPYADVNVKREQVLSSPISALLGKDDRSLDSIVINLIVDNLEDISNCIEKGEIQVRHVHVSRAYDISYISSVFSAFVLHDSPDVKLYCFTNPLNDVPFPRILIVLTSIIPPQVEERIAILVEKYAPNITVHQPITTKKNFADNIIPLLHETFQLERTNDAKHDMILVLNPKYLLANDSLHFYYPVNDNVLYISQQYDVMYASKNTMYGVFTELQSNAFIDYLDRHKKPRQLLPYELKIRIYNFLQSIFETRDY
jgi:hypothetical protein